MIPEWWRNLFSSTGQPKPATTTTQQETSTASEDTYAASANVDATSEDADTLAGTQSETLADATEEREQRQRILTHWLSVIAQQRAAQQEAEASQGMTDHLWRVYRSPAFAELWYLAREAGERMRARALTHLYTHRAHPGGLYPDPRADNVAFSAQAILATAARLEGIDIKMPPTSSEEMSEEAATEGAEGANERDQPQTAATAAGAAASFPGAPLAWFVTFPKSHGAPIPPQLWLHPVTHSHPLGLILFAAACLLGYITKESGRILDASAPHGITTLPQEPGIVALMHQFAIALLHLEPDCPADWNCHCAAIRYNFTAPPSDHEQPTETLSFADIARAIERNRQQ